MGPWDAFTQGFAQSFGSAVDDRRRKQMMQQEQMNRMEQLRLQSQLENEQLTPEMKLVRLYQQNPQAFSSFRQAQDPGFSTDQAYKVAQIQHLANQGALANANFGLDKTKLDWQMNQPKSLDPTNDMKNFQFLSGLKDEKGKALYSKEELLKMLFQKNTSPFGFMGGGMPMPITPYNPNAAIP